MNGHIAVERFIQSVIAGALAFGLVTTALGGPAQGAGHVTITVFADRYTFEGRAFDDLDFLEKHITATPVRGVTLLICGARATRAIKAVVHRFRYVPLQMRVPDVDERECMSNAPLVVPVRQRNGQRPFGIDDAAVDRYWQDLMP